MSIKNILILLAAGLFGAGSMIGAYALHANDDIAAVSVASCGTLAGLIYVHRNGRLEFATHVDQERAAKILPMNRSSLILTGGCAKNGFST